MPNDILSASSFRSLSDEDQARVKARCEFYLKKLGNLNKVNPDHYLLEPENRITCAWIILQMNQHYFENGFGWNNNKMQIDYLMKQDYFANRLL